MKVVPPARIPANKVAVPPGARHERPQAVGEDGRVAFRVFFYMKSVVVGARRSVLSLAVLAACAAHAQTSSTSTLGEVMVTASRFSESARSLTYAASVITAQDIRDSGVNTVNEAITRLLGVPGKLDTAGGGNTTIDLRGFGDASDRNQVVVVDGRRLRDDDLSTTNMAMVPIGSVERIEVVRGSGAVQYGEGATAGVIVITTKAGKGMQRSNSASVYASAGTFGTRELGASAVLASGGFSVDVAAKDAKSDGFRDNFASTSNSLNGTAQWSNDWLRLGMLSGRQVNQSGWPGSLTNAQYASNPSQTTRPSDFGYSKSENTGVFVDASVAGWDLGMDANQRTRSTRIDNFGASAAAVAASDLNLRARRESSLGSVSNALVLGLDTSKWSNTVLDSTFKTIGSFAETHSEALYITDDVSYQPTGTRVSLGLRNDSVKKSETSSGVSLSETPVAWQLGLSQELPLGLVGYGHVGNSYRLATADEYTFTNAGTILKTQTSRDSELGLRWTDERLSVDGRVYQSLLSNEIGFDGSTNVNFDASLRRGLEIDAKYKLASNLKARLNGAYRESRFVEGSNAGNEVPHVPRQTAAVGATWQVAPGHTVDGSIIWVSAQITDSTNACKIPAYSTADVRYAYTAGKLDLSLGVKNLTDEKYYTQSFGCPGTFVDSVYPEAGRAFTATARLNF